MKSQFILFKRSGVFYSEDTVTGKQTSLRTKIKAEAGVLLNAKNESARQPNLNLQLARTYLSASDPEATQRTWQDVMDEMESHGNPSTKTRCACAMRSKAFDTIRLAPLIQTKAEQIRAILEDCTVSTAHYLKRLHNLAYGLGWLPSPVLPPKQWPKLQFKAKRGITAEEHERIVAAEKNVERKFYYQLLWEIGASQSDAAALSAANVDWKKQSLRYNRMKTGTARPSGHWQEFARPFKATPLFRSLFPENFRQQRQCARVRVFAPLPAARNPGRKPSLVSLRLGGAGQERWLPGAVCDGEFGPQQQSGSPRLREKCRGHRSRFGRF
jgi:hypothetical protein